MKVSPLIYPHTLSMILSIIELYEAKIFVPFIYLFIGKFYHTLLILNDNILFITCYNINDTYSGCPSLSLYLYLYLYLYLSHLHSHCNLLPFSIFNNPNKDNKYRIC
ncbi:hypothetical protein Ahy_Scaffold1g107438 isoform G [Arachis hypogaea]|uniref:Uncharacterized protein n=1 Tax=Arachis hypogaea TaxID=3818 RepID=A0A444WVX4_ARAHY|nr:hypothetical protein Ahy_Scaffold1g107438 isoform G [Arachis hypogaea]